jgi:hypothetical protein
MKKVLIIFSLLFLASGLWSQTNAEYKAMYNDTRVKERVEFLVDYYIAETKFEGTREQAKITMFRNSGTAASPVSEIKEMLGVSETMPEVFIRISIVGNYFDYYDWYFATAQTFYGNSTIPTDFKEAYYKKFKARRYDNGRRWKNLWQKSRY